MVENPIIQLKYSQNSCIVVEKGFMWRNNHSIEIFSGCYDTYANFPGDSKLIILQIKLAWNISNTSLGGLSGYIYRISSYSFLPCIVSSFE